MFAQDQADFMRNYYQDFLDRTEIQDMLRVAKDNQKDQRDQDEALGAVTGATPAQQLAAQANRNKSFSNTISSIARNASMLRDSYSDKFNDQRRDYYTKMLGIGGVDAQIYANRAAQQSQAGTNSFKAGAEMFASGMDGIAKGKKPTNNSSGDETNVTGG